MAEKLGVRLREVKKDLEETIDKHEYKTAKADLFYSIHAKNVIGALTENENKKIELAALHAYVSIASISMGKKFLQIRNVRKY